MKQTDSRFLISLDPCVKNWFKQYVRKTGRTTTGFIRKIIYLFINQHHDEFAKELDFDLMTKINKKINS